MKLPHKIFNCFIHNINQRMKKKLNQTNQSKQFESGWSVNYKTPKYDALLDPHASFYFDRPNMKKHLLKMRKSIKREGTHVDKKQIPQLITTRLQYRALSLEIHNIAEYEKHLKSKSQLENLHDKQTEKKEPKRYSYKSESKQKQQPSMSDQEKYLILPAVHQRRQKPKKKHRRSRNSDEIERLNETSHKKFLEFLTKKKISIGNKFHAKQTKQIKENDASKTQRKDNEQEPQKI